VDRQSAVISRQARAGQAIVQQPGRFDRTDAYSGTEG